MKRFKAPLAVAVLMVAGVVLALDDSSAGLSRRAHDAVKAGALLVDVRTAGEFQDGHIPGSVNIPVDQVRARLREFGPVQRTVVLYCHSGARSRAAERVLREAGYTDVVNLGSMDNW